MTDLSPILYANGALRLTRHGAGRGDTVLLLVKPDGSTDQFSVPDAMTEGLMNNTEAQIEDGGDPGYIFKLLRWLYSENKDEAA